MLTLGAYVRYVRDPSSCIRYVSVGLPFAWGSVKKHAGHTAVCITVAGLLAAGPA